MCVCTQSTLTVSVLTVARCVWWSKWRSSRRRTGWQSHAETVRLPRWRRTNENRRCCMHGPQLFLHWGQNLMYIYEAFSIEFRTLIFTRKPYSIVYEIYLSSHETGSDMFWFHMLVLQCAKLTRIQECQSIFGFGFPIREEPVETSGSCSCIRIFQKLLLIHQHVGENLLI